MSTWISGNSGWENSSEVLVRGIHFLKWIITKEKVMKWCFICLLVGSTNIFLSIYHSQGWDRWWTGRWTGSFWFSGLIKNGKYPPLDHGSFKVKILLTEERRGTHKGAPSTSKQYYETPILKVSSSTLNLQKLEVIKTHPSIMCLFFFFLVLPKFLHLQGPVQSIVCRWEEIFLFWDITFLMRKDDSSRGVGILYRSSIQD